MSKPVPPPICAHPEYTDEKTADEDRPMRPAIYPRKRFHKKTPADILGQDNKPSVCIVIDEIRFQEVLKGRADINQRVGVVYIDGQEQPLRVSSDFAGEIKYSAKGDPMLISYLPEEE